jgi:hypothetical protein
LLEPEHQTRGLIGRLKSRRLFKARRNVIAFRTGDLGMSNVLKVSLQTTIYSLAIADGRSDGLRASWESIAKR